MTLVDLIRNVIVFFAFKPFWFFSFCFVFNPWYSIAVFRSEMFE